MGFRRDKGVDRFDCGPVACTRLGKRAGVRPVARSCRAALSRNPSSIAQSCRGAGATSSPQRPDCVAGHVRFELRNVAANYPFERSHKFPGIQPNSGRRDYSRLSCGVAACPSASVRESQRRRGRRALAGERSKRSGSLAVPPHTLSWREKSSAKCAMLLLKWAAAGTSLDRSNSCNVGDAPR